MRFLSSKTMRWLGFFGEMLNIFMLISWTQVAQTVPRVIQVYKK
jgi:hypothetical protein